MVKERITSHELYVCTCVCTHTNINNAIKILERSYRRVFIANSTHAHTREKLCVAMKPEKLLVRCAWGPGYDGKGALDSVLGC